jgi:hypothetical protein
VQRGLRVVQGFWSTVSNHDSDFRHPEKACILFLHLPQEHYVGSSFSNTMHALLFLTPRALTLMSCAKCYLSYTAFQIVQFRLWGIVSVLCNLRLDDGH